MSKPDFVENGAFSSMIYLHIISYTIDMVEFRGKLWDYQKANPTWGNPKLCWWLDPKFDIGLLKERQKNSKKNSLFRFPSRSGFPIWKKNESSANTSDVWIWLDPTSGLSKPGQNILLRGLSESRSDLRALLGFSRCFLGMIGWCRTNEALLPCVQSFIGILVETWWYDLQSRGVQADLQ